MLPSASTDVTFGVDAGGGVLTDVHVASHVGGDAFVRVCGVPLFTEFLVGRGAERAIGELRGVRGIRRRRYEADEGHGCHHGDGHQRDGADA